MNIFGVKCPGCKTYYLDIIERGRLKLVHTGLWSSHDDSDLPTDKCVPYHDYVTYEPCSHCCPDVFLKCRACKLNMPGTESGIFGRPTEVECFFHYYRSDSEESKFVDEKSKGAELYNNLYNYYSLEELRRICTQLGIKYEDIDGWNKLSSMVSGLIDYCKRDSCVKEIVEISKQIHPNVPWDLQNA